jgi:hypothetical protein
MVANAAQIGFDRFIQLDWVAAALGVRAGTGSLEDLSAHLMAAGLGKEAQAKTKTKLNALVLEPRSDLADFICRGVMLFAGSDASAAIAPFAWGAALAAYPYFGRVAEFTGRLTAIQGDCSVAEIHRRMSEIYGDREVIKRATQAVLQSQANWGAIARVEKDKRLVRSAATGLADQRTSAWLIEAALRYQGRAISLATMKSTAVLYPFLFDQPIAYVIANSKTLELRSEGQSQQLVALQAVI